MDLEGELKVKANRFKIFYPMVFVITVVAIMLTMLAFTEGFTRAELQSHQDQQTLDMLMEIFPEASFYTLEDDIYIIYNSGRNEIGYAFYAEGMGWGGKIVILVGLEDKETIKGIVVVSHIMETPAYWQLLVRSNFFDQLNGLKIEDCKLKHPFIAGLGEVEGVTGATTSSRAVVDIVREAALEKIESIK
jgi:Na+-translocating ferredoxin:NAD+ oxidoreductase RnfG subunit